MPSPVAGVPKAGGILPSCSSSTTAGPGPARPRRSASGNHYKAPLSDLGLHYPPSGRLGAQQVHYALGSIAANILAVVSYKVMPKQDRGIRLTRLLHEYIRIPARVIWESGRRLLVRLAGADVTERRKTNWLLAFGCPGQI